MERDPSEPGRSAGPTPGVVTRDELILRTRQLIAEGERLAADPSLAALRTWLQLSDDLLASAWGTMDRYHLAWLMVGKPKDIVRGRDMTRDEAAAYVRDVAAQKNAALRMSLDAVERQGMPFLGEAGGVGAGSGAGAGTEAVGASADSPRDTPSRPRVIPLDPDLARRLDEVRRAAAEHRDHDGPGARRAPRPERLQR